MLTNSVLTLVGKTFEGQDHYATPRLFIFGILRPDFLNAAFTFFSLSRGKISNPAALRAFFLITRFRNIQLQFIISSSFSSVYTLVYTIEEGLSRKK
jgi:hypothetical protein